MVEVLKNGITDFDSTPTKTQDLKNWAQQFNWKKTAEDYLKFYSKVYKTL